MPGNQPSFTSPEEEATHSTTPEAPIAPKNKNNKQEPVTSSSEEIAHFTTPKRSATAKSRSRSKRSPASAKEPAHQRQRQPKQKKTSETDKPGIAGPWAQDVNAQEPTTEQGKKGDRYLTVKARFMLLSVHKYLVIMKYSMRLMQQRERQEGNSQRTVSIMYTLAQMATQSRSRQTAAHGAT